MSKNKYIKKFWHFLIRTLNRINTHILSLTLRKKLMINRNDYDWGIVLQRAFRNDPPGGRPDRRVEEKPCAPHFPSGTLPKKSIFLIPGSVLLLSAVAGPLYYGHYTSAGLALLVLGPTLFCAMAIEILWQKEDALHFARYAAVFVILFSVVAFAFPWAGGVDHQTSSVNTRFFYFFRIRIIFLLSSK